MCKAINAIRDMNTHRSLEFGLIAQDWSAERVKNAQKSMFVGFQISKKSQSSEPATECYGQILNPSAPDAPRAPEVVPKPKLDSKPTKRTWAIKKGDE